MAAVAQDIAPRLTRAAVTRDPLDGAGLGLYGAIQSMASPLGVELTPVNIRNRTEMERTVAALSSANSACGSSGALRCVAAHSGKRGPCSISRSLPITGHTSRTESG